jgi:RNA polymerase sigma factor (sigma-70 family)
LAHRSDVELSNPIGNGFVKDSSERGSVTRWIAELKTGDAAAAQQLWTRYQADLHQLARKMLGSAPRKAADEEDVAASVFESICLGAARGRFQDLATRDELWWLLVTITRQKAVSLVRYEVRKKRGGGNVRTEADILRARQDQSFRLDELIGKSPTPEFLATMNEEQARLLVLLRNDQLRRVAVMKIQGYTHEEIATDLGISSRSVIRKVKLIRDRWAAELDGSEP